MLLRFLLEHVHATCAPLWRQTFLPSTIHVCLNHRKVLGQSLDPARTPVASIMSPDPTWVKATDDALDALATMIERRFRHLPVSQGR